MLSIIGFLLILGPLVVFHEFGHYLFARLFNVKAEVFSIGFGPRIWSKQLGETELRISAIPLGGFVKLMGEDGDSSQLPETEQARALPRQAPWKRFFIFFGGPLFNFIFAIFVFMAILVIGEPHMASVFGRVVKGSYAEKQGFRSGDRILAVDAAPVKKYEELVTLISENPGKPLSFRVERRDPQGSVVTLDLSVAPKEEQGLSMYGEQTQVGELEGAFPSARSSIVGISDPSSLAAKAGLRTGDKITKVNGAKLEDWESLLKLYDLIPPGRDFVLNAERGSQKLIEMHWSKPSLSRGLAEDFGLHSSELFVEKTIPGSPAEQKGLMPGDRLLGNRNQTVGSFFELRDLVQSSGKNENRVVVKWERDGQIMSADITPTATTKRDVLLKKTTQFTVGVMPMLTWQEPATIVERTWNPALLVYRATERMVVFTWRNVVSLRKMITGDVSLATLGGPILIGKLAGESISRGLIAFLTTMAILSVGLGVLNILPIPVLDGGHLMLLTIEIIRGKPLQLRQMELIQQVGLALILLLMAVVIKNDLTRLPFFD